MKAADKPTPSTANHSKPQRFPKGHVPRMSFMSADARSCPFCERIVRGDVLVDGPLAVGLLDAFLFGRSRAALDAVRDPLRELQDGRCFYCGDRIGSKTEVDHFVPWTRYPNDDLENLVATDPRCNSDKRDFLAAAPHVRRWAERNALHGSNLKEIAIRAAWRSDDARSASIARAIYLHLPENSNLWLARQARFERLQRGTLVDALGAPGAAV
jgi:hypothetical protein